MNDAQSLKDLNDNIKKAIDNVDPASFEKYKTELMQATEKAALDGLKDALAAEGELS